MTTGRGGWTLALGALLIGCPGSQDDGNPFGSEPGDSGTTSQPDTTGSPTTTATPTTTSPGTTVADSTATTGSTDDGPLLDVGPEPTTGPTTGPCEGEPPPVIPAGSCADAGISVAAPFDANYLCRDLGPVPGVDTPVGGATFMLGDEDLLWIGGNANHPQGRLFAIPVSRDPACHVNGFAADTATEIGDAPYNDGGFAYGPGGVLFMAEWPVNDLAQYLPGSTAPDLELGLAPFGVGPDSVSGLNFVPPTFMGELQLKIVTWPGGDWFTLELMPDGMGTQQVTAALPGPSLGGGPEGFVHISADNVGVGVESILVAEWLDGNVALYEADAVGDPVVASRQDFVTGLEGALGAHLDRVAGDFLFTTFGGGDRLIAIRGFVPNPEPEG